MSNEINSRKSSYERMQGSMHIGMGTIYIILGIVVLYVKYFGAMELPTGVAYFLGTMMLLYGIFRLWRGFTFLKQRNSRNLN